MAIIKTFSVMGEKMILQRACLQCGEKFDLRVEPKDYMEWQNGKLIQNVMPYLTVDERELLISGYCGSCFDRFFDDGVPAAF